MPLEENHPEYILIDGELSGKPCPHHATQKLVDCFNDPVWRIEPVDVDKIMFTCQICDTVRVYKLKPEKTLLRGK